MARRTRAPSGSPPLPLRSRPALRARLDDSSHRLVLISGPAGSGKTTLATEWAASRTDVVRVHLSRREDEPTALTRAILSAAGATPSGIDTGDPHSWLDAIREVLASRAGESRPCLLLDGADALSDPAALAVLADLVELGSRELRVIVTSRERCPAWLARHRATGESTTISASDLRLTEAEVTERLGHPAPDLAGWAAGVRMRADLGHAEGDQAIRDYLHGEVLRTVTTEVRQLLYAVAVVGPVEPALALHLTGDQSCGRLLARFAATTQLAAIDDRAGFSLHPVLARYLRSELTTEDWPLYADLRTRHASWLADNGRLGDAVRTLMDVEKGEEAERTLLTHWQRTVLAGHVDQVLDAVEVLPSCRATADPRLCVVRAMANLARGDLGQWRRWADVARAQADDGVMVDGDVTLGSALRASGRLAEALLEDELSPLPSTVELRGLWRAIDEVAVGLTLLRNGRATEAASRFRHAEVSSRVSGDHLALVHALAGGALAAARGGSGSAMALADEAIAVADHLEPTSRWVVANAHLALAEVHAASGRVRPAIAAATATLRVLDGLAVDVEPGTRRRAEELRHLACTSGSETSRAPMADSVAPRAALSERERRVLKALCGPLTLREIAEELFVSHNTVKTQVNSIFRKLGVHDRATAVAAARSRSLLTG